jgi:predicted HTH domain antitoxin
MTVTVEIPDAVTRELDLSTAEMQRRALVGLVVEGYRRHELSRGQVSEILDLSFSETAELLAAHGCGIGSDATFEDFEREFEEAQSFLKQ